MIPLGIMTLTPNSEEAYINELAKRANLFAVECYRFIPSEINPYTLQVTGKKYDLETKQWVDAVFPIPSLLYDRCFYGDDEHSKQCLPIVTWLKTRKDITFLGYGLPNKQEIYDVLKQTMLAPYLPQTATASTPEIILNALSHKTNIILKPINGSQGYGIYKITRLEKGYQVETEKHKRLIAKSFPDQAKLLKWLGPLVNQKKYLIQPYLPLVNDKQQPFDVRILVQKDEAGFWQERGRGIRFGQSGGILANLSAGGTAAVFDAWAKTLPNSIADYVRIEINEIVAKLPLLLEDAFLPLFEIGIDLGIAPNGAIWILDINSKPGRKVVLHTEPKLKDTLFCAPLRYATYLFENKPVERKNIHETTLSH
ncbi:YheC/YheD family protein [Bacillus rubiinfantis]|uniref:YheC/YheD family endospore coat-associated protein n=1 Tax=Bacillus rubiinfantis TaxID=1499680 RepID=UPI0005A65510|nr:YheC/YheD family protein [Bacillus rubiinfantis]